MKSAIDFLIAAFTVGNGRLLLFATGHYQGKADIFTYRNTHKRSLGTVAFLHVAEIRLGLSVESLVCHTTRSSN